MLRPLRLPVAVTALAVSTAMSAALLGAATPALAAPAPGPSAAPQSDLLAPPEPTSAELGGQVAQQEVALAAQEALLAAASAQASQALEAFQLAQRQAEEAARAAAEQAARLATAQQATVDARARLERYVGSLYRTGMGNPQLSLYSSVLDSRNPRQLFSGLGIAQRVGGNQGNALVALNRAETEQAAATARAAEADAAQKAAEATAATAKQQADTLVAQLREQVAARTEALLRTQAAAAAAEAREAERAALLAQAEKIARQRADAPDAAIDGAYAARPAADCKGLDVGGYPNGQIPSAALCPLWGTKGQLLRADAAAAFNDMSRAYAAVFGAPVCVGDSYRSYDEQVAVAAAKPGLAARPGSSNHGWGLAVDLCDGVQDFGSAQHRWMRLNSMLYGWFLPSWAQQGRSKPEPWHWEFAG